MYAFFKFPRFYLYLFSALFTMYTNNIVRRFIGIGLLFNLLTMFQITVYVMLIWKLLSCIL